MIRVYAVVSVRAEQSAPFLFWPELSSPMIPGTGAGHLTDFRLIPVTGSWQEAFDS